MIAHLEVHLHLRVCEAAVFRRRVLVVGDLFHQIEGAAFVEIFLDARFFHATSEKEGECHYGKESATHDFSGFLSVVEL